MPSEDFHVQFVLGGPSVFWFDKHTSVIQAIHWKSIGIVIDHIGANLLVLAVHDE